MTIAVVSVEAAVENLPGLMGYVPSDCLVILGLQSTTNRIAVTSHVSWRDAQDDAAVAQALRGMARQSITNIVLCAWTEREAAEVDPILDRAENVALTFAMDAPARVHVTDTAIRHHDGRLSPRNPEAALPLKDPATIAPNRDALVASIAAGPDAAALPATEDVDPKQCLRAWFDFIFSPTPTPIEQATPADLAALCAVRHDIALRDFFLFEMCPTRQDQDAERMWGPDEARQGMARLIRLAHRLPDEASIVDVLAMLATVAWSLGEGAVLNIAVARALRIDPGHILSNIVANASAAGVSYPRR